MHANRRVVKAVVLSSAVSATMLLAACGSYVKRDEFSAQIAEIKQNEAGLRSDLDATKAGMSSDMSSLRSELDAKFKNYDATISQLQGRVSVSMATTFDFDKAELRGDMKPILDNFASVIREHHPDAVITVEGFADAAGSPAYNKRLGKERAEAVRDYLVLNDRLDPGKLRVVSYGKDRNRQVVPGAWGDKGEQNRRVSLVIEYAGASTDQQAPPANPAG